MRQPEGHGEQGPSAFDQAGARGTPSYGGHGYGRYMGLLGVLLVALALLNAALSKHNGARGIEPGQRMPPFAVPLATGGLTGDANIATHADEGAAGRLPACAVRGPQILNICQLYEKGPVVLALFVARGSCPAILGEMQAIAPAFPGVRFAGVSLGGDRAALRKLIRDRGLSIPIGIDRDGALTALYRDASCPQVTFAEPGGTVQGHALLTRPSSARLRTRVQELVAASEAHGWRGTAAGARRGAAG
jgi:hypothetical protein